MNSFVIKISFKSSIFGRMNYPSKILERAVEEMSNLPGIGKRTALRLILHMLHRPKEQTENLAEALKNLVNQVQYCKNCHSISDSELCEVCSNPFRNHSIICVVEDIRDVMAIENTGQYKGVYHVLGGKISPMDGIGPAQLQIESLLKRIQNELNLEVIFALSSTMEGDTTAFYLYKILNGFEVRFSTIARGLGIGDELEYADEATLVRSLQNRIPYESTALKST